MAFTHGSKAKFHMGTAAAPTTLGDISTYMSEIQFPRSVDTAETSTLGNTFKTYVPGLSDGTVSLTGRFDPIIDTIMNALVGVASVDYLYMPQGITTGLPRFTGSFFLTSYQTTSGVGDVSGIQAQFQLITAVTRTLNA